MKQGKQDIYFAFPAYGGNGGVSMMSPNIMEWFVGVMLKTKSDPRIGEVYVKVYSDTPITMMRNRMVVDARNAKADILVMVDSDMYPDIHLGQDPHAKPWFDTTLNFVLGHMTQGPVVVAAPYCGPPPGECVYAFNWTNGSSTGAFCDFKLEMYSRTHAQMMAGIQPAAAVATGLIMYDMRAFELTEPIPGERNYQHKGWFYYEYTDGFAQEKASTEDVTATRDMATAGYQSLGYNPVFVNWDSWAGHWKPYAVPKPVVPTEDSVGDVFTRAIKSGRKTVDHHIHYMGNGERPKDEDIVWGPNSVATQASDSTAEPSIDLTQALRDSVAMSAQDRTAIARLIRKSIGKDGFTGVEVGTHVGETANAMCESFGGGTLYCVDDFSGFCDDRFSLPGLTRDMIRDAWKENTHRHRSRVKLIEGDQAEIASQFEDRSLDFVFIDADHSYDSTIKNIEAWLPKVRLGGIIAGHDYGSTEYPAVKIAVDEAMGGVDVEGSVWSFRVPQFDVLDIHALHGKSGSFADYLALCSFIKPAIPADRPFKGVELGSFVGDSTRTLLTAFRTGRLTCIDTWKGPDDWTEAAFKTLGSDHIKKEFLRFTAPFADRIDLIDGDSADSAKQFEDGSLDFVFVDADHSYEGCKRDIEAWLPKVRPGGVICGHDYGHVDFPGVKVAVHELLGDVEVDEFVWSHTVPGSNGHVKTKAHKNRIKKLVRS